MYNSHFAVFCVVLELLRLSTSLATHLFLPFKYQDSAISCRCVHCWDYLVLILHLSEGSVKFLLVERIGTEGGCKQS